MRRKTPKHNRKELFFSEVVTLFCGRLIQSADLPSSMEVFFVFFLKSADAVF